MPPVAAVVRHHVNTPFGTVEYAEFGVGDPVLVSHGIFHGCDGGLLSVRSSLPGRRIIAPSRYGYLGSGLPAAAIPEDQVDALEQAGEMDEMIESIFPIGPRAAGAVFDAYVSNPAVNDVPIQKITVPTIIIHAKDDPLCVFAPAEQAAHRISGCILVAQESGGHLGLGQYEPTRAALEDFLKAPMVV